MIEIRTLSAALAGLRPEPRCSQGQFRLQHDDRGTW